MSWSSSGLRRWLYNQLDVAAPPRPQPRGSEELQCGCIQLSVYQALVAQSSPILCDPMDCSPPGFSVHGISQARILKWVAIPFFRGSSWPRAWTRVSCIAVRFLPSEPPGSKRTLWVLFSVKAILPGFTPTTCHAELTDEKDIHVLVLKPPRHNINFFNNQ